MTLDYNITTSTDELKNGVTIAIFEGDNKTTRIDRLPETVNVDNDTAYEMSELGGLSRTTSEIKLANLDSSDKFNKSGLTNADVLLHTNYVVQLNTESIVNDEQEALVLAHEIGHSFGLSHMENDSLMTLTLDNTDFTGEISDVDATLASAFITSQMLGVSK